MSRYTLKEVLLPNMKDVKRGAQSIGVKRVGSMLGKQFGKDFLIGGAVVFGWDGALTGIYDLFVHQLTLVPPDTFSTELHAALFVGVVFGGEMALIQTLTKLESIGKKRRRASEWMRRYDFR